VVPRGAKAWYEVEYTRRGFGETSQRVGWTSEMLPRTKKHGDIGVGFGHSWGFDPFTACKYNQNTRVSWGSCVDEDDLCVVGVAVDMEEGNIWFSLDGEWGGKMGVAFSGVSTDFKLFPAISGGDASVLVNFGEREFNFEPPDETFRRLNSL